MGCVWDQVPIEHFASQIITFYHLTGAPVDLVTYTQQYSNALWNGLTYNKFNANLRLQFILSESQ